MEEQFVLRVPPAVAERIERLLNESPSSEDMGLDLSFSVNGNWIDNMEKGCESTVFSIIQCLMLGAAHSFLVSEDGRTGTFAIGDDRFSASLLDLPTVVESYKTYDDTNLIKTADIGQIIMVREESDGVPEAVEYRHGLTPPMRDARRRRFRREPDLNPEVVRRVEKDLQSIMSGGTAENFGVEIAEQEEDRYANANNASKEVVATPSTKPDIPEPGTAGGEPDGSDSDDSDDSI